MASATSRSRWTRVLYPRSSWFSVTIPVMALTASSSARCARLMASMTVLRLSLAWSGGSDVMVPLRWAAGDGSGSGSGSGSGFGTLGETMGVVETLGVGCKTVGAGMGAVAAVGDVVVAVSSAAAFSGGAEIAGVTVGGMLGGWKVIAGGMLGKTSRLTCATAFTGGTEVTSGDASCQ